MYSSAKDQIKRLCNTIDNLREENTKLEKQRNELLEALESISKINNQSFELKSFNVKRFKADIDHVINNCK